jgi:glyoxylase-like metal-dependent hydrolase (beta-lactamase superfamily II)
VTRLERPFEGLLATAPSVLPYQADVLVRSFVLERADGNVIVYNSPAVSDSSADLAALGGASRILINHAHEAMYGPPDPAVPTYVHERDAREVQRSMPIAGTFATREFIGNNLEVIPTPGHTVGTTSYLWDNGRHRFLFTGDFIWIEHGQWKAVVLGNRDEYLESLALVRELDFDVLVPWGVTDDVDPVELVTRAEARDRIASIIARVEAGEDR